MFPGNMSARDTIPPVFGGNLPPGRALAEHTRHRSVTPVALPGRSRSARSDPPQRGRPYPARECGGAGIFGYGSDELVGLDFATLVPGDSVDRLEQFWIDLKPCRIGLDRPLSGRRKDGSLVSIELGLNVVPGAESRLIVACVVDVTQKHDLETRLAVAIDEKSGFSTSDGRPCVPARRRRARGGRRQDLTGLRKMAETLNLDGAIVWQAAAGKTSMVPTHIGCQPRVRAPVHSRLTISQG